MKDKIYYFAHPESDSVWKQTTPMIENIDGHIMELDEDQYKKTLEEYGLKDEDVEIDNIC